MSSLMDYTKLEKLVKKHLKPSRFEHSRGVADVCSALSERFLCDKQSGLYTGIFHDWCRYDKDDELLNICKKADIDLSDEEIKKPMLLHGAAAAVLMPTIVGPVPKSYIKAIRHHTLGSIDMGILGACLYIADYTEPNRKHITNDDRKEIFSLSSLEEMVMNILRREEKYYREKDMTFAKRTLELYYFIEHGGLFKD